MTCLQLHSSWGWGAGLIQSTCSQSLRPPAPRCQECLVSFHPFYHKPLRLNTEHIPLRRMKVPGHTGTLEVLWRLSWPPEMLCHQQIAADTRPLGQCQDCTSMPQLIRERLLSGLAFKFMLLKIILTPVTAVRPSAEMEKSFLWGRLGNLLKI